MGNVSTRARGNKDSKLGLYKSRRGRTKLDRRATDRAIANAGLMRALGFTLVDAYYLGFMDARRRPAVSETPEHG